MAPPVSGYTGWWDASDPTTITSVAGAVSQWNDKSTSGFHVSQATGSQQPITGTRTINGLNVLDFDGVNDVLGRDIADVAQPVTWFVVGFSDVTGATNAQLIGNKTGGVAQTAVVFQDAGKYSLFAGTIQDGTGSWDINPHVISAVFNGASSGLFVDGVDQGIGANSPGTGGVSWINFGADTAGATPWNGVIGESILFSSALSTADRQAVERYLRAKWLQPVPAVAATQQVLLGQQWLGVQLPTLARLFKNTNLIFGTSAQTLGAFTLSAAGSATSPTLPEQSLLIWRHPVEGINLPELGPNFFKNTNLIFGSSNQTLGSFTAAAAGSTTAPQLPQLNILFGPPPQLRLEVVVPAVFGHPAQAAVTGTSATTLGAFTSNAQGSTTAPQLPQIEVLFRPVAPAVEILTFAPTLFVATPVVGTSNQTLGAFTSSAQGSTTQPVLPQLQLLLQPYPPSINPPILGPALFTPFRPVTGTTSTTLGSFTAAGSGSATSPLLPQLQLLAAQSLGIQLPLFGPTLFGPRPLGAVTGTSATTLGNFTSSGSGSATSPTLPQQALFAAQALGIQLPLFGPALFGAKPVPTVTGTSATTLGAFTSSGSGSFVTPALPWVQVLLQPTWAGVQLPLVPIRPATTTGSLAATLGAFTASASGSATTPAQPWIQVLLAPVPVGIQLPVFPLRPTTTSFVGQADANPITITLRDHGHTATLTDADYLATVHAGEHTLALQDGEHTVTIRDHGHTATIQEQH